MRSRKIRVSAAGIRAQLGSTHGELMNMSLTGALVCLDQNIAIGAVLPLKMPGVEVTCQVLRASRAHGQWLVAVVFTDVSPYAAKAIRALVADMFERSGTQPA